VRAAVNPAITAVLARLVTAGPGASVTVGERHLIGQVDVVEEGDPADLLGFAADLLTLSTLLAVPSNVVIDEADFLDLG
jgi:hypothetical protein